MIATNEITTALPAIHANAFVAPIRKSAVAAVHQNIESDESGNIEPTITRPYAQLAKWTLDNIGNIDSRIESFHSLHCRKTSLNGKFTLWAHQWPLHVLGEHIGTCRMVLIQGSANEIINTWVFPTTPSQNPVFAAELIAMAGAPRLTFIDIQSPAMNDDRHSIRNQTLTMRESYATILSDEIPPQWAISDSMGGYIFSRQLTENAFADIQQCYKDYFESYLKTVATTSIQCSIPRSTDDRESLDRLHAYQVHHMESSPGNTFLSKLFGIEWTTDFLANFLFTLA